MIHRTIGKSQDLGFEVSTEIDGYGLHLSKIKIMQRINTEFSIDITLNSFEDLEALNDAITTHLKQVKS